MREDELHLSRAGPHIPSSRPPRNCSSRSRRRLGARRRLAAQWTARLLSHDLGSSGAGRANLCATCPMAMNPIGHVSPVPDRNGRGERWILAVVLVGAFMAILDGYIVNVAVPSIRRDLHCSFGAVELVVTAYTITYACLLITGGRLGDLVGRKRMFIAGLAIFTASSALCGAAPSIGALVAARAFQGVGAAMFYPQVLAVIQVTFEGEARSKALGVFGSTLGLAVVVGQIVGGSLIGADLFGWQWRPIFLVNVPVGIAAVIAAVRWLPGGRGNDRPRLDLAGVGLVAAALLLLIVPLLSGRDYGWPAWMVACLVASFPAFGAFIVNERRVQRRGGRPLVRLDLFANPGFSSGVLIAALFMVVQAGYLFVLAVYLQNGMGFTALRAGLTFAPAAIAFFAASLTAPRLVPLLGRSLLALGYVLAAVGLAGTAAVVAAAGGHLSWWELAPTLFLVGAGQGLGFTPLVGTIIAGLAPADAGAASGVVTTTLQVGAALGVAVISLIFFTLLGGSTTSIAAAHAFAETLPFVAALYLVAAVLVHRLPRGARFANSLIEQQPGWAHGVAYSMFLMTGGRIGDRLFKDILAEVTERRLSRTQHSPLEPGDFLAYHYEQNGADQGWLNYLAREALIYRDGEVPYEEQRTPVIQRQVDEIRSRQADGVIDAGLDPTVVRLLAFALASYPRLQPQIVRMTTGLDVSDPQFTARWQQLLRKVGDSLAAGHPTGSMPTLIVSQLKAGQTRTEPSDSTLITDRTRTPDG